MKQWKVLVVGPSAGTAKGGISAVTQEIAASPALNEKVSVSTYASYMDAPFLKNLLYSIWKLLAAIFVIPGYDVIHIQSAARGSAYRKAMYLRLAKLEGKKAIIHIHNSLYLEFYRNLSPWKQRFLRKSLCKADLVLVLSEGLKEAYVKTIGLQNCQVLGNGIDTEQYGSLYEERKGHPRQLLFLGKIWQPKGIYDLIPVLHRLKERGCEIRCVIAGNGEIEQVKQLSESYGLTDRVFFPGWVDTQEKLTLLKQSDVLILPSYTEGLPMCILEAMAAGKPIVSTTVGAIPEVVENGVNGYLFSPGDQDAMFRILHSLWESEDSCREMGRVNYETAKKRFDREKIYGQLYAYYCTVAEGDDRIEKAEKLRK